MSKRPVTDCVGNDSGASAFGSVLTTVIVIAVAVFALLPHDVQVAILETASEIVAKQEMGRAG